MVIGHIFLKGVVSQRSLLAQLKKSLRHSFIKWVKMILSIYSLDECFSNVLKSRINFIFWVMWGNFYTSFMLFYYSKNFSYSVSFTGYLNLTFSVIYGNRRESQRSIWGPLVNHVMKNTALYQIFSFTFLATAEIWYYFRLW